MKYKNRFENSNPQNIELLISKKELTEIKQIMYALDSTEMNMEGSLFSEFNKEEKKDKKIELKLELESIYNEFEKAFEAFFKISNRFILLMTRSSNKNRITDLEQEVTYEQLISEVIDFIEATVRPLMSDCTDIYTKAKSNTTRERVKQYKDLVNLVHEKVYYLSQVIESINDIIAYNQE